MIRAITVINMLNGFKYVPVTVLALKIGRSVATLDPIISALSRFGIVESKSGPGGGVRLTVIKHDITLFSLAEALGCNNRLTYTQLGRQLTIDDVFEMDLF
jgi:DNA-binding IscR family transcriptional regulator